MTHRKFSNLSGIYMSKCILFPGLKTKKYASFEFFDEKVLNIRDLTENNFFYKSTGSGFSSVEAPVQSIRKPKLLHIEDNDQISFLLHLYLKDRYEIESVQSGEKALKKVQENSYDLIIVDIQLGEGMNGFETSRKIRELSRYKFTPIIALTTNDYNSIREDCMYSMVNAYIKKPFTKPYLLSAIDELDKYLAIT